MTLVRITPKDAEARAVLSVAPDKVNAVMSSDVEVVNGCLAYPFDLRFANKGGVMEVMVDAGDGKILSSTYEPPAAGASPAAPPRAAAAAPEGTPSAALPPGVAPLTDPAAAAEEALIRKVVDAEEDAWNRSDAKAFAARFQEEGSYTDVFGAVSFTRADLEKRQVEFFASALQGQPAGPQGAQGPLRPSRRRHRRHRHGGVRLQEAAAGRLPWIRRRSSGRGSSR